MIVSDVTGDGVPELLFVEKSPYSEEYVEYDALNIFTVENGAAKQIYYADHWETQVAGGNAGGRRIVALLVQWHAG